MKRLSFINHSSAFFVLFIVVATGCDFERGPSVSSNEAQAAAVAELVLASFAESKAVSPDQPQPGDKCPDCNGTGRVGDGTVFQTCLACDGTGKVISSEQPLDSKQNAAGSTQTQSLALPKKSAIRNLQSATAWTATSIQVCGGDFCYRVHGQLHHTGTWFYSYSGAWYVRRGEVWKSYEPASTFFMQPNNLSTDQSAAEMRSFQPRRRRLWR